MKLLVLVYVRAVACGYQIFNINTEAEKEFGKFDDVVFEFTNAEDQTCIRLVQIKHVKDESLTIQFEDLRPKDKSDKSKLGSKYILTQYFESFLIRKREVANLTLFTNLSFGYNVLDDFFEEYNDPDDIFDVPLPDLRNSARTSLPCDHNEHHENQIKKNPKKHKLNFKKLQKDELLYNKFLDLVKKHKSAELAAEDSIEKFCDKFIFATGQPNDNEMDLVLGNEIPRISTLPILDLVYAEYIYSFLCWLDNKYENEAPLSQDNLKHVIPLIRLKTENLKISLDYHELLKNVKYKLEDSTIRDVEDYFNGETLHEKYFMIFTKFPKLTLAKIFQCFEYKGKADKGECLIIEAKSKTIEESVKKSIELFEYFKFCVIIFHEEVGEDYKSEILKMLKISERKIVILNTVHCESGDNCCFEHLQPESKANILNRTISYNGKNVPLLKLGAKNFYSDMQDAAWLSKLIDEKLVLNNISLTCLENNYIQRKLVFQTKYTVNTIDYNNLNHVTTLSELVNIACFPKLERPTLSEDSMVSHGEKLVMLIAKAGMGKTTLLQSISKKYKSCWTEIIKLTSHVKEFIKYQTAQNVIEFVTKILNFDLFTAQLFKHQIEAMGTVVIMFDGFDEISQEAKDAVLRIIENLLKTKVHYVWVTSRPICKRSLEEHFCQPTIELTKFTKSDVVEFIAHYWSESGCTYDKEDLDRLTSNLFENYKIDFHIPLYTNMAAEYFKPNNFDNRDLISNRIKLYERCINKKLMHLLGSKIVPYDSGHEAADSIQRKYIKDNEKVHKQLAMQILCPDYGHTHKLDEDEIKIINSIGIARVNLENNDIIHFDHRTFAEYFVAKFVFDQITGEIPFDVGMLDLLVRFKNYDEFQEILKFLDAFLDDSEVAPNKIKLTKPEHIELFKELLNTILESLGCPYVPSVLAIICFDNVDVLKYRIDKIEFLIWLICYRKPVTWLKMYLKALGKELSPQLLREFIVLFIVKIGSNSKERYHINKDFPLPNLFVPFLEEIFPDIYKMAFEYLKNNLHCVNETQFINFFENVIKSKYVDNFLFSIYCFAESIKNGFSENSKRIILDHLLNVSKECKFDFDVKGKYLIIIKIEFKIYSSNIRQNCYFFKNLIKAFQNQKKAFMKYFQFPENVLSFDELEMLLADDVEIIPENFKNKIKSFGIVLLLQQYFKFTDQSIAIIRPYIEKFLTYRNEELRALCDLIQIKTSSTNIQKFTQDVFLSGRLNYVFKLNLSEPLFRFLYSNPFLIGISWVKFLKIIDGTKSNNSMDLETVFDNISEIHPKLFQRAIKSLLKTSLKLEGPELFKKIMAGLDNEIDKGAVLKESVLYSELSAIIYSQRCRDSIVENANANGICKDYFLKYLSNLKIKIEPINATTRTRLQAVQTQLTEN